MVSKGGPLRLCLNMIVRDEAAVIERCLAAALPFIDAWVICDTGSRDATPALIEGFFQRAGLPGELHRFGFESFEQARNAALERARGAALAFDYLLLLDADMELVVEDAGFRRHLTLPAYLLEQRSGLHYHNVRLLRRDAAAQYHGLTHEALAVDGEVPPLSGLWIRDHNDGGTRSEKLQRDLPLLEAQLAARPGDLRTLYYLAQTHRESGNLAEAARLYAQRAAGGGWAEEAWHARLQEARCYLALGEEAAFLAAALAAYDARPARAESLWELARFHRTRGRNEAAALFALAGMALPPPAEDRLFVEPEVYAWRCHEELAIVGFYCQDAERRQAGHDACEGLALHPVVPPAARGLARANLAYYAPRLDALAPGWRAAPIETALPAGWQPLNPSVARDGESLRLILRGVNYRIDDKGHYKVPPGEVVRTRNWLLDLSPALAVERQREILPPTDLPSPALAHIEGLEDLRLFAWRGRLWGIGSQWGTGPQGLTRMVVACLDEAADQKDWWLPQPMGKPCNEKNWMPLVQGDRLGFLRYAGTGELVDEQGRLLLRAPGTLALDHLRGGSQLVAFDDGWLAVTHEVAKYEPPRRYLHRLVWFDQALRPQRLSRAFIFNDLGVEFAAGLAWHPDGRRLLISYGVDDREAWLGSLEAAAVQRLLELPPG